MRGPQSRAGVPGPSFSKTVDEVTCSLRASAGWGSASSPTAREPSLLGVGASPRGCPSPGTVDEPMLPAGSHAPGLATSPSTCTGCGGVSGPSEDPYSEPQRWAHFRCRRSLFPEGSLLLPGRVAGGSRVVSGLPLAQSNGVAGLEAAGLAGVCSLQREPLCEGEEPGCEGGRPREVQASYGVRRQRGHCGGHGMKDVCHHERCLPQRREGPQCPETLYQRQPFLAGRMVEHNEKAMDRFLVKALDHGLSAVDVQLLSKDLTCVNLLP
ncbi:uncharacterized protein AAG666_017296 [Megaptera novaeangliae]